MKKFEGWKTEELQYVATLMAGRDVEFQSDGILNLNHEQLYGEIIREIRKLILQVDCRIAEEE